MISGVTLPLWSMADLLGNLDHTVLAADLEVHFEGDVDLQNEARVTCSNG